MSKPTSTSQTLAEFEKLIEAASKDSTGNRFKLNVPKLLSACDQTAPIESHCSVVSGERSSIDVTQLAVPSDASKTASRADKEIHNRLAEAGGPTPDNSLGALSAQDKTELETALRPKSSFGDYEALDFQSPAELLTFFNENLKSGVIKLHEWQKEVSAFLASVQPTAQDPLRFLLVACNGSGKDAYIIAPFAIWFCACKVRSRVIITSSSYQQLESQTENYIKSLAESINAYMEAQYGFTIFVIKKMHIVCKSTGSEIKMFATDDPGRAEGYHPFPDYPGAEMAIIVNESKTVADSIFGALRRCTGFNYWLEISSPGKTSGHFYNTFMRSESWLDGKWATECYKKGRPFSRKVSAFECSHISRSEIADAAEELGESSALFRSMYLAEFTTLDEAVVISLESLTKCKLNATAHIRLLEIGVRCGLDLAAGGDENVLTLVDGNKILERFSFREVDTVKASRIILEKLLAWKEEFGLRPENSFGDDGGIGRGILDNLKDKGWACRRVNNQSAALNTHRYGNRGAELYFSFKRIVEEGYFISDGDPKMEAQLTSRYYKQSEALGKIVLESKQEARKQGRKSPDRADSLVLAFCGITIRDFLLATGRSLNSVALGARPGKGPAPTNPSSSLPRPKLRSEQDLENYMDDLAVKRSRIDNKHNKLLQMRGRKQNRMFLSSRISRPN